MEWGLLLLGLLFAPIIWAFTKGRDVPEVTEDHDGATGYGNLIKHRDHPGQHHVGGGPGASGSS
jgi:hypothetical protein